MYVLWNSLPQDVAMATSIDGFMRKLDSLMQVRSIKGYQLQWMDEISISRGGVPLLIGEGNSRRRLISLCPPCVVFQGHLASHCVKQQADQMDHPWFDPERIFLDSKQPLTSSLGKSYAITFAPKAQSSIGKLYDIFGSYILCTFCKQRSYRATLQYTTVSNLMLQVNKIYIFRTTFDTLMLKVCTENVFLSLINQETSFALMLADELLVVYQTCIIYIFVRYLHIFIPFVLFSHIFCHPAIVVRYEIWVFKHQNDTNVNNFDLTMIMLN